VKLSSNREKVFEYIAFHDGVIEDENVTRSIANDLGLSTAQVSVAINGLAQQEYIEKEVEAGRTIRVALTGYESEEEAVEEDQSDVFHLKLDALNDVGVGSVLTVRAILLDEDGAHLRLENENVSFWI
jgi:DNA-binding MarR family transcriptional regulator